MSMDFIAHVQRNEDGSWAKPHELRVHLRDTAKAAKTFSSKFLSGDWGEALGLGHDVGKGRLAWLNYLKSKRGYSGEIQYDEEAHLEGQAGKLPHAIYGAEIGEQLFGKVSGRFLAYCIAGHHAGLPDWSGAEGAGQSSLQFQKSQMKDLDQINEKIIAELSQIKPLKPPWKFKSGLDVSLWIRMLFSSLVDADYLDTEIYMNENKAQIRGQYCSIPELLERLTQHCEILEANAKKTRVNEIRKKIRAQCRQAAQEQQGNFSLTVPTGGGKTLNSLSFALEHAKIHKLDRVIYVIPYTSILEQTVNVFRSAVGEDQVVEHHSSINEDEVSVASRLATENWDAPLVVTTSVQFFESLFASKPSRCRKLHNITRSVIVLDEAQLVPVELLAPILETLQLLVERYHVSLVISTATQPAFKERMVAGKPFKGLKRVKEIIGTEEQVRSLYQTLIRNHVHFPDDLGEISGWGDIAARLKQQEQVLCIVSDRRSCRELHKLMPPETYHLSALMCGQHRSDVIKKIKQKLADQLPVRVISTQLVEAGVDLDFPIVYRALAGLDSIAQAAGRCNREGRLEGMGQVVVFNSPRMPPTGILRKAAETTRGLIMANGADFITDPNSFSTFFEELYWKAHSLDKENILTLLDPFHNNLRECSIFFRTAAKKFQIIDQANQQTILVHYGKGNQLIDQLKASGPDRSLMRKLQRYTVTIYSHNFDELKRRRVIEEVHPQMFALSSDLDYSEDIGLLIDEPS